MKVTDFFLELHKRKQIGITEVFGFSFQSLETYSRFPLSAFFTSWQKTRNS